MVEHEDRTFGFVIGGRFSLGVQQLFEPGHVRNLAVRAYTGRDLLSCP